MDHLRLTDFQSAKTAPHFRASTHDKEQVNDRGVISGFVPALKFGGR